MGDIAGIPDMATGDESVGKGADDGGAGEETTMPHVEQTEAASGSSVRHRGQNIVYLYSFTVSVMALPDDNRNGRYRCDAR